jgi:hypothetical protein
MIVHAKHTLSLQILVNMVGSIWSKLHMHNRFSRDVSVYFRVEPAKLTYSCES